MRGKKIGVGGGERKGGEEVRNERREESWGNEEKMWMKGWKDR